MSNSADLPTEVVVTEPAPPLMEPTEPTPGEQRRWRRLAWLLRATVAEA